MHNDPYKSDWENTVESAREQENRELSIEARYPPLPDKKEEEMNDNLTPAQVEAITWSHVIVAKQAAWDGPGKEEAAIEAKDALEKAFPWLLDDAEDYMEENY